MRSRYSPSPPFIKFNDYLSTSPLAKRNHKTNALRKRTWHKSLWWCQTSSLPTNFSQTSFSQFSTSNTLYLLVHPSPVFPLSSVPPQMSKLMTHILKIIHMGDSRKGLVLLFIFSIHFSYTFLHPYSFLSSRTSRLSLPQSTTKTTPLLTTTLNFFPILQWFIVQTIEKLDLPFV